jgi:hypothetical protein
MRTPILMVVAILCMIVSGCISNQKYGRNVLVITNSESSDYLKAKEFLVPYLDHFGIPYELVDIAVTELTENKLSYALLILSHPQLAKNDLQSNALQDFIEQEIQNGGGVLSFDPQSIGFNENGLNDSTLNINWVRFSNRNHFITLNHQGGDTLKLFGTMPFRHVDMIDATTLIDHNGNPLLLIKEINTGRFVSWTSMEWMHSDVLGSLGGLDDCLWRSIVWAARKPFVIHVLPPYVTMRVDDVAGRGNLWNKSPLYWVETANKYGFKPWLGLFIYNLSPEAVDELRNYINEGLATASPHAFGRPNRNERKQESYVTIDNPLDTVPFYYYPDALPYRSETYDEFIFYDHHNEKPWSNNEIKRSYRAVDEWYQIHQPLPMSKYLVPHWYEIGTNAVAHARLKWGMEYTCLAKPGEKPYSNETQWLPSGPFRLYETPGSSTGWTREGGQRPVYYADFVEINGNQFFNCLTEIRDDAGYEWAPDNDVEATVGRGIRQLSRAIKSRALAVLFTHETDYIYSITPENWDKSLALISEGISGFNPVYKTMDEALAITRAYHTADLEEIFIDESQKTINITLNGYADVPTLIQCFEQNGDSISSRYIQIPAFNENQKISVNIK